MTTTAYFERFATSTDRSFYEPNKNGSTWNNPFVVEAELAQRLSTVCIVLIKSQLVCTFIKRYLQICAYRTRVLLNVSVNVM